MTLCQVESKSNFRLTVKICCWKQSAPFSTVSEYIWYHFTNSSLWLP